MSYAVIGDSVRRRTDPYCYQLYGFLDETQVNRKSTGLTAYGVAKAIRWRRETVISHLRHLAEKDLIEPLEDGTIAVRTNAVRHRVPAGRSVRQIGPPNGRSGWWVASKESAGQTMTNVRQTDVPEPLIDMGTTSSDSRDAVAVEPRIKGNGARDPRAMSDCRCGRLLLTATDHEAGMCVFCRDDLEDAVTA